MPGKILVVDDEPDLEVLVRQRFRKQIQSNELEFIFAHDGVEALEKLRQDWNIAVVLTDINMPHMDGLTLLTEMERLDTCTRAVVVSAYGDMENIRTAMNRGAFDFLTKPIDFHDVEITIHKTLEYVEQLKEIRRSEEYRIAKEFAEYNYRQLQELQNMRESLSHMIVHDLRIPLTSFIGGLESMRFAGELNSDQVECLEIALRGGDTLLSMVNDLLDISKMEDGSLRLEFVLVSLPVLVEECLPQVLPLAREKDQALVVEIAADLPEIMADSGKLRRTLVNLLGNSVHFTPEGGSIRLAANLEDSGESIVFKVVDNGDGIPAEEFDRIFEKFGQVQSRQAMGMRSTGLGLTFCKLAVEAHGGRIWVESEVGQGSTFSFSIPRQRGNSGSPEGETPS